MIDRKDKLREIAATHSGTSRRMRSAAADKMHYVNLALFLGLRAIITQNDGAIPLTQVAVAGRCTSEWCENMTQRHAGRETSFRMCVTCAAVWRPVPWAV